MLKKRQKNLEKYKIKRLSRESIEAEEIFLDSKKIKESPESEREKLEFPIKKGRVYFLYFLIAALLLILFIRVVDLQIINGSYWRELAESNRIRSYPIKALRGIIYDRKGDPLLFNKPKFDLLVVPADLLKQEQAIDTIDYLSDFLKEPKEEIEDLIKRNANLSVPIAIKENISKEMALVLESKFSENPSVLVETGSQRNYIDGLYFSHILGYLRKISPEERQKRPDYLIDDWMGADGLELYYEDSLRGSYGEKLVEVDSQGEIKNIFARKESGSGKNIVLSIDSDLQKTI